MKHKILFIVSFVSGLSLGVVAGYQLTGTLRSQTDKKWHVLFNEDKDHQRIMEFQDALTSEPIAKDPEKLSKRLEAQLKLEDLIIKSREAEYVKIIPFNAIIAGLVSAVISMIVSLLVARRGRRDVPNR